MANERLVGSRIVRAAAWLEHLALNGLGIETPAEYKAAGASMRSKTEYYRELAERSQKLAEDIPDADAKAHMLDVARQYEKLAEEAEFKKSR